jgi:hypothetical protein
VLEEKRVRVSNFAAALQDDLMTVTRSVGLHSPAELQRHHVEIVVGIGRHLSAAALYPYPIEAVEPFVWPVAA